MKPDSSHIRQIKVVSNTHWDREFRRSFERTRRNLLTMLDTTLDILEADPAYASFTLDGHTIMLEDYLELRPERKAQIKRLIQSGRLIAGPYYTLAEEFSITHEALVRNLMFGRKTLERYGGKTGTVAYTPSSWGQTGQLPQILREFGLDKMMFYRGISHHEADAEWIWSAPDGTEVLASRFALYARYNWYYQVHRAVTRGTVFDKSYAWGQYDEIPFRLSDTLSGEDQAYDIKAPAVHYDKRQLKQAIEQMVQREGRHFTTEVFLAMHGHDISVAHPLESQMIADAAELLGDTYTIEHTDLEGFWNEAVKHLNRESLPVLSGERRAYLKTGMWTFLFPGTISARTYLKQMDYTASNAMVYYAEPLASLAAALGAEYPARYMERGWKYLLSNHTHDANGGCAPDAVCADMEYRYRKAGDIGDIVSEDAMAYIAAHLSPEGLEQDALQLIVYNPLPVERTEIVKLDLELPRSFAAGSVRFVSEHDREVQCQAVFSETSSVFMDSIWDVPTILDSSRISLLAELSHLPGLGYRVYRVQPEHQDLRNQGTLVRSPVSMENEFLKVKVNTNGTVDIHNKQTGRIYRELNYLRDQGECGNAWKHVAPRHDRIYNSLGMQANIAVTVNGSLSSTIEAGYKLAVPIDYGGAHSRNDILTDLDVKVAYTLEKGARAVKVKLTVNNRAKDHWLRACLPTGLESDVTWADSHYDVVSRPITLPDSSDWVEQAEGTHPLRTFVGLTDGQDGIALLPKGLYEYEAFDDEQRTLALTLIRACRIKLAVSEEKLTELPDQGIQCPGERSFEYAIHVHEGDWKQGDLLGAAARYGVPVRAAAAGRGQGSLPAEAGLFTLHNRALHVTCVKQAEDGSGLIIRLFNASASRQEARLRFGITPVEVLQCTMDEQMVGTLDFKAQLEELVMQIGPKKIITLKIRTEREGHE
ncbi:glycoside hydrolase family 38 N-terminal domain-containing protein [Paenibacillus wynnii]|uniref:glycoside hydrolase family 38 N-terminal domain-containing protein n=1 Tax=Paenibacillus wynnii TaxID=268407 RepID=UPI002790A01C|nr:glycoside hydrolase family 38 C-terminal domain-containing protein [Paenibacillus wynnii]MDQ0194209.1 alpha-mannosidase [Paenibacillus wynnii]